MKHLFIESLKAYELSIEEKHTILAKGTRLDGGPDTDGEEDCYIIDPTTKQRYKKSNDPTCL